MEFIYLYEIKKPLINALKWGREGLRRRDDGGELTNV
jgi:hypothetical protein